MANDRGTYREIEHTADLGVEITAADLPALFASAGEALYALIADPATIENREAIKVSATGANPEDLLHTWLCELLALFNVEGFVGKRCEITHISDGQVQGRVSGEKLDLKRHAFHTEIKGVTYHDFKVWQDAGTWHARVIFDV
ncbi:MAG TPA: archease [Candidatus Binatia bacterium]|nr:archease [Candidatus Binatia bacterium]